MVEKKRSITKRGIYKVNTIDDIQRIRQFKIYGKEILLGIAFTCGIVVLFLFLSCCISLISHYIIQGLILIMLMILSFLMINTVFYHKKYPNLKNLDILYYFGAIIFIMINFLISILKDTYDTTITNTDIIVFTFNFAFAIILISLALIKSLLNRVRLQKKVANIKPTMIYKISSLSVIGIGLIFGFVIIDTIIISFAVNGELGVIYTGVTVGERIQQAWNWGNFILVLGILGGFIAGVILIEWRYDILFDWDDDIIKPYGMG